VSASKFFPPWAGGVAACAIKKMVPFLSGTDGGAERASPIGRSNKEKSAEDGGV